MKQLKLYLKQVLIFLGGMIILSIFLSILNYFGLLVGKTSHIISIIYVLGTSSYIGITCGKNANQKGYLEGLKIGGILILLLIFLNLIFYASAFTLQRIIYYVFILLICIGSSMIGINKKKQS